uniref:Cleavage and polyadenylation specificity factor subunit 4 n=1 Tax=Lotharella globosa TaxID=91324 RepID=A0A6V3S1L4_9EUKA
MATIFAEKEKNALRFGFEKFVDDQMRQRRERLHQATMQICKFYQKGPCMRGDSCPYRHSRGERSVVCKHWLRGLCKKSDKCEYLHEYDMSRMQQCTFFITRGECTNKDCTFLHQRPEDRQKDCPWYDRGFCQHGPKCRNRHRRRAACPDYLAGFCIKGPTCGYGHPKFFMPTSSGMGSSLAVMTCANCGQTGHLAGSCPNINTTGKRKKWRRLEDVTCFKCGQKGHYATYCTNERVKPPPGGYKLPGMQ